jgi:sarcosine oxidase subunit delta
LGDATRKRPSPEGSHALDRFFEYVYLRENPAGRHCEYWYHGYGCQSWLIVTRDTTTHEISKVEAAAGQFADGDA